MMLLPAMTISALLIISLLMREFRRLGTNLASRCCCGCQSESVLHVLINENLAQKGLLWLGFLVSGFMILNSNY